MITTDRGLGLPEVLMRADEYSGLATSNLQWRYLSTLAQRKLAASHGSRLQLGDALAFFGSDRTAPRPSTRIKT